VGGWLGRGETASPNQATGQRAAERGPGGQGEDAAGHRLGRPGARSLSGQLHISDMQSLRPLSRRTPEPLHPPPTHLVWDQRLAIPHESSTSLVYGLTDQPTTRSRARPAGASHRPRGRETTIFFFFFSPWRRVSPAPHPPNHAPFLEAGGHSVPVNRACLLAKQTILVPIPGLKSSPPPGWLASVRAQEAFPSPRSVLSVALLRVLRTCQRGGEFGFAHPHQGYPRTSTVLFENTLGPRSLASRSPRLEEVISESGKHAT